MSDDKNTLTGWTQICQYLGLTRYVIIQRGYPVFSLPYSQTVWARRTELDAHTRDLQADSKLVGKRYG